MSQKPESESSEPVVDGPGDENKDPSQTESAGVNRTSALEEKKNVSDSVEVKGDDSEPIATELGDEDKENRDPNDKPTSEELKTEPVDKTKAIEIIEIPSSQSTEETVVSDPVPMVVPDDTSKQPGPLFNINSALPTTNLLSEDQVTVIQNSVSTAATCTGQVITVGLSDTKSESKCGLKCVLNKCQNVW